MSGKFKNDVVVLRNTVDMVLVDKLKDKGFSNAECHYHGLVFIKVNWGE